MPLTAACSCSAIGALGRLLTESTGQTAPRTFNASSLRHEFIYETLGTERGLQASQAINGFLEPLATTVREKTFVPQGAIAVQASPVEIGRWLPRIFGADTGGEYLSNNLIPFDVMVYRENGIFSYQDAVVARAVLRGRTSESAESVEFVDLIVQLIGKNEIINTGLTWPDPGPALGTGVANLPYTFWESTLDLNGTEFEMESFTMVIDNMVDFRLNNKRSPSCIRSLGRKVNIEVKLPFTCGGLDEAESLNTTAGNGELSLATTGMSTRFIFRSLRNEFKTPTIPGRVYIPLELNLVASKPNAAQGIVQVIHDETP